MVVPKQEMIYSFNLESMKRKDCYEDVPNSIIEKEYDRIHEPEHDFFTSHRALMEKQEQMHEKYRLILNEKTDSAIKTIKGLTAIKTPEDVNTSLASYLKKEILSKGNTKGNLNVTGNSEQGKDDKYL